MIFESAARSADVDIMLRSGSACVSDCVSLSCHLQFYIVDEAIEFDELNKVKISAAARK